MVLPVTLLDKVAHFPTIEASKSVTRSMLLNAAESPSLAVLFTRYYYHCLAHNSHSLTKCIIALQTFTLSS